MTKKSVVAEAHDLQLAIDLVRMGARMQLLEAETSLSRERLIRLYKEVKGVSPPKGMLPFSTEWFLTWKENIESSLFLNIHDYLVKNAGVTGIQAIMRAYQLYLEQVGCTPDTAVLSLMRAWTLVRFVKGNLMTRAKCTCCGGQFVAHTYDLHRNYECGLCNIPSRAGRTKKVREAEAAALQAA